VQQQAIELAGPEMHASHFFPKIDENVEIPGQPNPSSTQPIFKPRLTENKLDAMS